MEVNAPSGPRLAVLAGQQVDPAEEEVLELVVQPVQMYPGPEDLGVPLGQCAGRADLAPFRGVVHQELRLVDLLLQAVVDPVQVFLFDGDFPVPECLLDCVLRSQRQDPLLAYAARPVRGATCNRTRRGGVVAPDGVGKTARTPPVAGSSSQHGMSGDGGNRTRVLRCGTRASPSAVRCAFLSPGSHADKLPTGSATVCFSTGPRDRVRWWSSLADARIRVGNSPGLTLRRVAADQIRQRGRRNRACYWRLLFCDIWFTRSLPHSSARFPCFDIRSRNRSSPCSFLKVRGRIGIRPVRCPSYGKNAVGCQRIPGAGRAADGASGPLAAAAADMARSDSRRSCFSRSVCRLS